MGDKRLPKLVVKELEQLEEQGHKWWLETGTRHHKLFVNGLFCAVIPKCNRTKQESNARSVLNVRAAIRRAIQEDSNGTCSFNA